MNQKQQQKINRMLDTLFAFNPVSLRLILIDSNGKSGKGVKKREKHYSFIKGTNNSLLETLDLKFLEIMRSQTELTIPDISKSAPFSGLTMTGCGAFFCSIFANKAYAGFAWLIYRLEDRDERLPKLTASICEWIVDEISVSRQNDLTTQMLANTYVEFLDSLNSPAMIYIPASSLTAANVTFEALPQKVAFYNAFREQVRGEQRFDRLAVDFHFQLVDLLFPDGKTGSLFVFANHADRDLFTRYNTNELEYFQLLVQKIQSQFAMIESIGAISVSSREPFNRAKTDLNRLAKILKLDERHYQNFPQPVEGAMQKTNVRDILRDVVNDLRTAAAKKNLTIECELEEIEGVIVQNGEVLGDPWLLTLAIYNILDNAIRYSKTGSDPIQVGLTFSKTDWYLEISDKGPGISSIDLESILSSANTGKKTERINGLDFVQYAMRLHRGKLEISSRLGQGTTVRLTVPIV